MEPIKLLLVEDDNDFRTIIKESLELTGEYRVYEAKNGMEGLKAFKTFDLDIIVADIDMPVINGLEMVDLIRMDNLHIPILVASALTNPENLEEGFKHNIDNYIKKPYIARELNGYVRAILKRIVDNDRIITEGQKVLHVGSYLFDLENRRLIRHEHRKDLTRLEASILFLLCKDKGELVNRKDILNEVWGCDDFYHSRSLDVFINKLRKYLKDDKSIEIVTQRGKGLKLLF